MAGRTESQTGNRLSVKEWFRGRTRWHPLKHEQNLNSVNEVVNLLSKGRRWIYLSLGMENIRLLSGGQDQTIAFRHPLYRVRVKRRGEDKGSLLVKPIPTLRSHINNQSLDNSLYGLTSQGVSVHDYEQMAKQLDEIPKNTADVIRVNLENNRLR